MDGRKFAQVPMGLPGVTAAARVLVGAGYEWTTHPCLGFSRRSGRGLRIHAVPGQPLREDPRHLGCCLRVRLQPARPPPPRRMRLIRMRADVGEPVPMGWRAAE